MDAAAVLAMMKELNQTEIVSRMEAANDKDKEHLVKKIISSHNKESSSIFEKAIRNLSGNLNEIAFKLTYGNKNQAIPDFFLLLPHHRHHRYYY